MTLQLLLRNARVEGRLVDVGIAEGRIRQVGAVAEPAQVELDLGGRTLLPGLVNAHAHLDKANLLEEMGGAEPGRSLEENRRLVRELKRRYTKASVKARASRALQAMVRRGTTAVRTQVDVDPTVGLLAAEALLELREEFRDLVHLQLCAFPQEGLLSPAARRLAEEALRMGVDLMGGLPAVEPTPEERLAHLRAAFDLAERYGRELEVQIDESNDPNDFLLPELARLTLARGMRGRVTATHCISLSRVPEKEAHRAIDLLAEARITVAVTPSCNLITRFPPRPVRASNSLAPVEELLRRGVRVVLGTDNVRDVFFPLGDGSLLREMYVLAVGRRMILPQELRDLVQMATVWGAEHLGLDYGLEPGKRADLVALQAADEAELLSATAPEVVIFGGRVLVGLC